MKQETISDRLAKVREKSGYTFRELETLTEKQGNKVTHGAIQAIEAGTKPNPTVQTIAAIARALGCSPGWLAFGE